MGLTIINGLPAHVLFVHVIVVLVPLTSVALVASVIWPAWIHRLGVVLPLLALITLASLPFTVHAGEWLEKRTASNALIRRHAELGDTLLPWVLGLFVLTVVVWWFGRRTPAASATAPETDRREGTAVLSTPVRIAAIVLSVAVAAGSVVQVYRIGDSGAKAAWHNKLSAQPVSHHN